MPLYQTSVLKNYLKRQDKETVAKAFKKFSKYFHNTSIQQNIRESKEEQFQEGFLRELFVDILGYTLNPQPNYNLTTELKNEKGAKKADGAILLDGNALGVIELKSTKTKDLESIRQQAFDYKANQTGCVYVITSNFEKLRFYINNAVEFEEFDLFTLTETQFELLYLCLHKDNLLSNVPLKIKEASVREEEVITKKFYNDYSLFKRELFRDLVKLNMKNEVFRAELNREDTERGNKNIKHTLFKKSQKLIDRFLFIFFAEDRDLLPPNSTLKILEQWNKLKDLDAYAPLYDRFKLYFGYLDTGRKGTDKGAEIFAYNGGLFKPDPILDSLIISDELLFKHTEALSKYDFESQVDVNILGHIFENSLNEIESVNAEIEGVEFDKQKTKRKKDGVFYTPKYITKYIVDNTVGKLCEEKKAELKIIDEEYTKNRKGRTTAKLKELRDQLENYRQWLLQITICDPACGSGAFLNQALDFLIKEHQYIDELQTSLLGGGLVFPDIENTVLENNIFGVDLNEESVEIAKLSLWLRTAQPRRKLNDLSSNIKCGNSLIDDPKVAGNNAFKWEVEFPQIFAKGGFDVVIGNPPYVRVQNMDSDSVDYFNKNYNTAFKNYDLYVLFTEKIEQIINKNGIASFIMPKKFVTTDYGKELKSFLYKRNFLKKFIDFDTLQIFKDATTYTGIFIFDKVKKSFFDYVKIANDPTNLIDVEFNHIPYKSIENETWILLSKQENFLFNKLQEQGKDLISLSEKLFQGLVTGKDSIFILEKTNEGFFSKETGKFYNFKVDNELFRPLLKGSEIGRYNKPISNNFIIFPYNILGDKAHIISLDNIKIKDENIYNYLLENEKILKSRENNKFNTENWYAYSRNQNIAQMPKPKIITQVLAKRSTLTIDESGKYCFVGGGTAGGYGIILNEKINLKQLLPILNSKLIQWFMQQYASPFSGGYFAYSKVTMSKFPIKLDNPNSFIEYTEKLIFLVSEFEKVQLSIINYLGIQFSLNKFSTKLQNWHELTFAEFIKELNKAIKTSGGTPLTKLQEMEWMEVFETKKAEAQTLKAEIDKTDKEIDKMVYELYGLSEEEISIVENSNN